MASSGKKKTTMAKLTRESKLRERRLDKQAKKDARKRAPALDPDQAGETFDPVTGWSVPSAEEPVVEAVVEPGDRALADA
jgi:hypothetical protein